MDAVEEAFSLGVCWGLLSHYLRGGSPVRLLVSASHLATLSTWARNCFGVELSVELVRDEDGRRLARLTHEGAPGVRCCP